MYTDFYGGLGHSRALRGLGHGQPFELDVNDWQTVALWQLGK
jgi:hypothetical protein